MPVPVQISDHSRNGEVERGNPFERMRRIIEGLPEDEKEEYNTFSKKERDDIILKIREKLENLEKKQG